jgi:very-short-patch-repair endonuclease
MVKIIENKNCKQCGSLMYNVFAQTQLCDKCRDENKKKNIKKQNSNSKPKYEIDEYRINFMEVTKEPYYLTTKGFNKVSKIKVNAYRNYFNMSWCEVVEMYGKLDLLYAYIKEEYMKFIKETGSQNVSNFAQKYHPYITWNVVNWFGTSKLMTDCGLQKLRYTEEDLYNNFTEIKNKLNKTPLFHEFNQYTKITSPTYVLMYNLKGKIYDNIVKLYVSDGDYNEYLMNKKSHKSDIGKLTGAMSVINTDQDYKDEFIRVFELSKIEYGDYPSRRLFNKLSKFDDRTYRKKYNKSWTEICKSYGYEIDQSSNKAEKMVLDLISKITNTKYKPQKTFNWLKGINNYPLYCDGYFPELNLVVEFDGRQHREPVDSFGGEERFIVTQQNDRLKDKLIPEQGLRLLRISSDEAWYDKEYLSNKLITSKIIQQSHSNAI